MKKILLGAVIVGGVFTIVHGVNNIIEENKRHEEQMVQEYVQCLEENFTQRSYCASKINSNYHYMDSLIKEHGYSYKQVGYDLYVVNSESVN